MPPMNDDEVAALKATHEKAIKDASDAHTKEKAEWEKKAKPPEDDPSLADKARKERESKDTDAKRGKALESAIVFNHASKDFVKLNQTLIPKTIEGLFAQADKETYDSQVDKANAIKVGIVQEYFAIQANMDMLTTGQKIELDEFLKLTKNVKHERVDGVYSMIFEPTLETARKIEKAKQLSNGDNNQNDGEKALADRMMKMSKKHYLGEKNA